MALRERLNESMKDAMRAKDQRRLGTIRLMLAALKDRDIANRTEDSREGISDDDILTLLAKMIKQREESAETYDKGGRPELADKEEAEMRLIESFLPAAPSEEEMEAAIAAALAETGITSLKQMGLVMKAAQAKLAGKRVDGKVLSDKVRAKLA